MYPINIKDLNSSAAFYEEVKKLCNTSKTYIENQRWCNNIQDGWLYLNLGYVLCIFLYNIENSQSTADDFIWIIVGDLPSMYLDSFYIKSTRQAVERYIELSNDWLYNAEEKLDINDCFPFNIEPTSDAIEMLKKRIHLLKNNILPEISEIFIQQ